MDQLERRQYWSQAAVGLASFLTPFLNGALAVAMPSIGREFSLYPHQLPLVVLAHLVPAAAFMAIFGRLSDHLGNKRIFLCGSALFICASITATVAPNLATLLAARSMQGLADSMTFGVGAAILMDSAASERRGRALGLNLMFVYVGLALGPLVGGFLTAAVSWRGIFVLCALIGAGACTLIARNRPPDAPGHMAGFDWTGAATYVPAMLALIGGLATQPSWMGLGIMGVGALLGARFVRMQARRESPLIAPQLFTDNRRFSHAAFAGAFGYTAAFSTSLLLSITLQGVLGLSPGAAGVFLLIQPATQALLSPLAGTLSDRIAPTRLSGLGLGVLGLGLWTLAAWGGALTTGGVAGFQIVLGAGFAFFASPNIHALMGSVDTTRRGIASGLLATMRTSGMSLSMALTGVILAVFSGDGAAGRVGTEALPAVRAAFALFGCFAMLAAWISFRGGRDKIA
ncbi:MFS transporter [Fundidesulfovibrio agrisoli]|uniref:MFS transporter n=1 Tax=Fundidesulfovibrio agrisoli TaxID=2922717 RepID=UPI001FABCA93|nr:MFS transporter [Fundidesulfovibrio agrisoli]